MPHGTVEAWECDWCQKWVYGHNHAEWKKWWADYTIPDLDANGKPTFGGIVVACPKCQKELEELYVDPYVHCDKLVKREDASR